MNEKALKNLEYYKIIDMLEAFATSSIGKNKCRQLRPLDNLTEIEIRLDVERALDLLPEEIKETAILFFFQGLKQKEISDLLHIKLSLVKYRVSKAKELLSKQLEEGRD